MRRSLVLLLWGGVGCASSAPASRPAQSEAPAQSAPEVTPEEAPAFLPTPFTAEQIRDATPAGRTLRFKTWTADGGDGGVELKFVEVDAEGAVFQRLEFDAKGEPLGEAKSTRETWVAFQEHAKFPAAHTVKSDASLEVPAGTYEAMLYEVTNPEKQLVTRYWFSPKHPGPPLKVKVDVGDKTVFFMEFVE